MKLLYPDLYLICLPNCCDRGVRKHEDYMGKYFISQYGAIKDIDFTPIFEEILAREGEV